MVENRGGILNDIKAIPASVNFLSPHMDFSKGKSRLSPSLEQSKGDLTERSDFKTPVTSRHKSVAGRNTGRMNTLVPLTTSIAAQISPLVEDNGSEQ